MKPSKKSRQEGFEIPQDASNEELREVLSRLVENGDVSPAAVEATLNRMRATTHDRLKAASKVEKQLNREEAEKLLETLQSRFERNYFLHEHINWNDVEKALRADPGKLWTLQRLEVTHGEPDVIDEEDDVFVFGDCSKKTPYDRGNVVYDKLAELELIQDMGYDDSYIPTYDGNAVDTVKTYGAELMGPKHYKTLVEKLSIDQSTGSFLKTPWDVRKSGHAFVGEFGRVQERIAHEHLHNRAFRAVLRVKKV